MSIVKKISKKETKCLMNFIDVNWKKGHVLAKNEHLLQWQYLSKETDFLNFYGSFVGETMESILGFISTNHFDPAIDTKDIWLSIWKKSDNSISKVAGLAVLWKLKSDLKPQSIVAVGINDNVAKLYSGMGFVVDTMTQYYYPNFHINEHKLLINPKKMSSKSIKNDTQLIEIKDLRSCCIKHKYRPAKTINYLINRYQLHPFYQYRFFAVYVREKLECILVTRVVCESGAKCMRIVDCLGDLGNLNSLRYDLDKLLTAEKLEYIDFFCYGISKDILNRMGFIPREDAIIPNYFEPFVPSVVDIKIAMSSLIENYVVFKGDSDQDRPNIDLPVIRR